MRVVREVTAPPRVSVIKMESVLEAAVERHAELISTSNKTLLLKKEINLLSLVVVDSVLTRLKEFTLKGFGACNIQDWDVIYNAHGGGFSKAPRLCLYAVMLNYYNTSFLPDEYKKPIMYLWGPEFLPNRWRNSFLKYIYYYLIPSEVPLPLTFDGYRIGTGYEYVFSYKTWNFDISLIEKNIFLNELREVMRDNISDPLRFSDEEDV
ncbi:ORF130 [Agrotis segetum granulovirus]|uniref:ORF130 n=1 Tax=Agrotis segetum granulosis virus TaxID=10464 RepID=Q6QXJ0_GVAS|nr:ORF130 [Agrotis segetum granulovirus]